jgi:hypothetical protein
VIFFTDENFAHRANALLQAFDLQNEIRAFLEYFPKGTPDLVWLPKVGEWTDKPIIVCGDGRILSNPVERAALRRTNSTFIYLASGWTNTPWNLLCLRLIKYWPDVVALAARTTQQAVIELSTRGHFFRKPLPG